MPDQAKPLLQPGDIASFNVTIVTSKGRPVGTCIKFRRFGGSDQMVHLRPEEGGRLMAALEEYYLNGRHKNLMYHFHHHPEIAGALPDSHPYNTLLSMKPPLEPGEAGALTKQTDVVESTFADRGEFLMYRVRFTSGERAEFPLHECVAHNLCSFIAKMVDDAGQLFGDSRGSA